MSASTHEQTFGFDHRAVDRLIELSSLNTKNELRRKALRILDVAAMAERRDGEKDTADLLERLRDAIDEVTR